MHHSLKRMWFWTKKLVRLAYFTAKFYLFLRSLRRMSVRKKTIQQRILCSNRYEAMRLKNQMNEIDKKLADEMNSILSSLTDVSLKTHPLISKPLLGNNSCQN
jgi:hypothetical protein